MCACAINIDTTMLQMRKYVRDWKFRVVFPDLVLQIKQLTSLDDIACLIVANQAIECLSIGHFIHCECV